MKAAPALAPLLLAGCATLPNGPVVCEDETLKDFVGFVATADVGRRMLIASDAASLRWVPPGSAVTMDFRADRLTVGYDADMKITSARCG